MSPGFADYVVDMLSALGDVSTKRMFGGGGVYVNGIMFALIADDCLYFTVDDINKCDYETAGSSAFTYMKNDKPYAMSYWLLPEDIMENDELRIEWAVRAWEAARRGTNKSKKK